MPRWYKGFYCYGKPQKVVEDIRKMVHWNHLGNIVPVVRVEKRAEKGRFFLFLAVESPALGEMPEKVKTTLLLHPSLKTPIPKPFDYEEIKTAVDAELDVHNYARSIPYPYNALPLFSVEDPFCAVDTAMDQNDDVEDMLINTQRYDRLMLWASALGSGSWNTFSTACKTLGLDNDGSKSRSIFRNLRLLGHLEASRNGAYWSVAPSVLAQLDYLPQQGEYFLCGRRDAEMLQALRADVDAFQEHLQAEGNGPATVILRMADTDKLTSKVTTNRPERALSLANNVAYRLARFLPPLEDWMNGLDDLTSILPHMFTIKRFDGTGFVEETFQGKSGLYELWPLEASTVTTKPQYTLFYSEKNNQWHRGDWYGLRFLSLQSGGKPGSVLYEPSTGRLAVPRTWHWPEIYERALVLASGQLPVHRASWLIYESIGLELLSTLTAKLNLNIEEASLHA